MEVLEWLSAEGCTHIVMEATGIYWKPVWHILSDEEFELVLANAAHVKNVPGRKTDVNDARTARCITTSVGITLTAVPATSKKNISSNA